MTHTHRNPKGGFYYGGEIIDRENIPDFSQNCHFFPAIIIPSKVSPQYFSRFYYGEENYWPGKIWRTYLTRDYHGGEKVAVLAWVRDIFPGQ